jgi:hypothetical protein
MCPLCISPRCLTLLESGYCRTPIHFPKYNIKESMYTIKYCRNLRDFKSCFNYDSYLTGTCQTKFAHVKETTVWK